MQFPQKMSDHSGNIFLKKASLRICFKTMIRAEPNHLTLNYLSNTVYDFFQNHYKLFRNNHPALL